MDFSSGFWKEKGKKKKKRKKNLSVCVTRTSQNKARKESNGDISGTLKIQAIDF